MCRNGKVVSNLTANTEIDLQPQLLGKAGANDRDRTDDLLITNELLYQLSYIGQKSAY